MLRRHSPRPTEAGSGCRLSSRPVRSTQRPKRRSICKQAWRSTDVGVDSLVVDIATGRVATVDCVYSTKNLLLVYCDTGQPDRHQNPTITAAMLRPLNAVDIWRDDLLRKGVGSWAVEIATGKVGKVKHVYSNRVLLAYADITDPNDPRGTSAPVQRPRSSLRCSGPGPA